MRATRSSVRRSTALPTGGCIGTGSVRRRAQLAHVRPDLVFGALRGNIETRLREARRRGFDAVVVASAALERLGLADDVDGCARPAVDAAAGRARRARGRVPRRRSRRRTAQLRGHRRRRAHRGVAAERAFLAELGGGCNLPCGASRRRRRRRARRSTRCSRRSTATSCCARACTSRTPIPRRVGVAVARASLLDEQRRSSCSSTSGRGAGAGAVTVYLVGAGPGRSGPADASRRGAARGGRRRRLRPARVARLLDLAPAAAERIDVGKAPGRVDDDAGARSTTCSSRAAAAGQAVVRLKGGDPFVFGRGGEEAEACIAARRPVRGRARRHERDRRARVRGHPGDPPRRVDERHGRHRPRRPGEGHDRHRLGRRSRAPADARGPDGRRAASPTIAAALIDGGRSGDTPVAAVRWGTRPEQRTSAPRSATIADAGVEAPSAIVVGDVAGARPRVVRAAGRCSAAASS